MIRLWSYDAMGPRYTIDTNTGALTFDKNTLKNEPDGAPICVLDPIKCIVKESALGEYELTMTYSTHDDAGIWGLIDTGLLISAPVPTPPLNDQNYAYNNHNGLSFSASISDQFFRIYKIEKNATDKQIIIYAEHLSYQGNNSVTKYGFEFKSRQDPRTGNTQLRGTTLIQTLTKEKYQQDGISAACYTPATIIVDSIQKIEDNETIDVFEYLTYIGQMSGRTLYGLFFNQDGLIRKSIFDYKGNEYTWKTDEQDKIPSPFWRDKYRMDKLKFIAIRDNRTIHLRIYDANAKSPYMGYNSGYVIQYGRNLLNFKWTIDTSTVVNAIIPYIKLGSTQYKDTNATVRADNQGWGRQIWYKTPYELTSSSSFRGYTNTLGYISDKDPDGKEIGFCWNSRNHFYRAGCWAKYPVIGTKNGRSYGNQVLFHPSIFTSPMVMRGLDASEYAGDSPYGSVNYTFGLLTQAFQAYQNDIAKPTVTVEVDFHMLGDSSEYPELRNLEYLWIFSQVRVKYPPLNYDEMLQVSDIEWDAIKQKYNKITLGNIFKPEEVKITE